MNHQSIFAALLLVLGLGVSAEPEQECRFLGASACFLDAPECYSARASIHAWYCPETGELVLDTPCCVFTIE